MKLSSQDDGLLPKCYFSHCTMPKYTDQNTLPTKQQPFRAINKYSPMNTIDLLLPEELYEIVEQKLNARNFQYAKVYLSLLDIVTGDFFNQYIKAGDIVMLSEGQRGIHNIYTLRNGILRLDLDKATYERCGLVGAAAPSAGRKHVKSRFVIELDLRLPSMQHGKKGFERIRWAFKNVLTESLTWLFVDLNHEDISSGPISTIHPQIKELSSTITRRDDITPPFVLDEEAIHDSIYEEQLLEWVGLANLDSPRVSDSDNVDSYLCRYALPEAFEHSESSKPQSVLHLRWRGFITSQFTQHIWLALKLAIAGKDDAWFALTASTFANSSCTILYPDSERILLWECE